MAITADQMFAVRATFDNVEHLYNQMSAYAHNINDGAYTLADVHALYIEDWGLCFELANEVNRCFTWACVSSYDIPQAVYDYLAENLEEWAA